MHSIKLVSLTVIMTIMTIRPAFAQGDGSEDAPVVSGGASLSVCLAAIEAERVRLAQPDATCDLSALRRVQVACAGQETLSIQHFLHLMEVCGMAIEGLNTLTEVFDAIDCAEPTGEHPTWTRRASCQPSAATSAPATVHPTTRRLEYVCVDGAYPVDRHGNATSGSSTDHCACNDGLPFRVERRYARREMHHGSNAVIVACAISHAGADIRGADIERIIVRITRLEMMCTDEEGHRTQTGDEPLLCRTIWTLIGSVAANQASISDLDRRLSDLELRVAALESTAANHEERITALEARTPAIDLSRFRIGLGLRLPVRFETGVVSAYGVLTLEWAPRFTESLGLYARANLGYGSYGDKPGQTGQVSLGVSGLWGVAAGLELEPLPTFTLDLGVAFDASLVAGPRGNAFGTYRWHNLGPELRARFTHGHFFIEGSAGVTWSRTITESNGVLSDVDGFGLVVGASLGTSF